MKNLVKITTVFFLVLQTIVYAQEPKDTSISEEEKVTAKIDSAELEKFIGVYLLEEAHFQLEIKKENNKMYVITEFSKDELIHKNENTLREPIRGVDLELIEGNSDALKFMQNGYEAIIVKVKPKK